MDDDDTFTFFGKWLWLAVGALISVGLGVAVWLH